MATIPGIPRYTRKDRVALRALVQRSPATRSLLTKGAVEFHLVKEAQQAKLDQVVAMSPTLEDAAEKILLRHGGDAVKAIKQMWPVDTGLSKDMWALVKLGKLRYAVSNPIDYAEYVHRKGQTRALTAPGGAAHDRALLMQRRISKDLAELFRLAMSKLHTLRKAQQAMRGKASGVLSSISRFFGG